MILEGEVQVIVPNPECRDFKRRYQEILDERQWVKDQEIKGKELDEMIAKVKKRLEWAEEKVKEELMRKRGAMIAIQIPIYQVKNPLDGEYTPNLEEQEKNLKGQALVDHYKDEIEKLENKREELKN